jgi:sugar phosphate isomerase/epimerase
MPDRPISLQLYTVREQVAADYPGTLRAVAEIGYRAVELVTLGSFTAPELRAELDRLGLQVSGMHVPLDRLENDLESALDEALALDSPYVICPWLPADRRCGAVAWRGVADALSRAGERCRSAGRRLCYHHHDFEFQPADGSTGFDILFASTEPALVKAELDVYWAAYAGRDPVALIRQLGERAPLIHLKDMTGGENRTFAEVGHGTLDFSAILAACDQAGAEWLIVEQDRCDRDPLESVRMSLEYLRSLGRS